MALLRGKRIFYVEDNLQNRAIVQLLLEQHGALVQFERWGGPEALSRLTDFMPVDLILLDLMLPRHVSGYDVYAAIRQHPEFAHIPVVAISAADPAIEMNKSRELGLAGFISKPINLVHFPQQVASLIEGEHIWFGG